MILRLFIALLLVFCFENSFGQNDNSIENSEEKQYSFANFLIDQQLFKFASEELERLHFLHPENKTYFNQLIFTYRMSGNYEMIRTKLKDNLSDTKTNIEYSLVLIKNDLLEDANMALKSADIDPIYTGLREKIGISLDIMHGEKAKLLQHTTTFTTTDPKLNQLINESLQLKTKSPVVAGVLSGFIPGTGKMYSKDYANGVISLLFVGATAYQAYTRFSKKWRKIN